MNKVYLVIIFLSFLQSCKSQNSCSYINDYYQLVYQAEEAFYEKDYYKTYKLLTKACSKCKLLDQEGIGEMYFYAESAARIGSKEKAIELIELLILNGYNINLLANNDAFVELTNSEEWMILVQRYDELHNQYLSTIDLDLRQELKEMRNKDQIHRRKLKQYRINQDSLWTIINRIDSLNDIRFKEILRTKGYPIKSIIGDIRIDGEIVHPGTLLFHFDDYDFYTKTLKELIDKGEAPPQSLGNFVDSYNRRIEEKEKFVYGIYDNVEDDEIIDVERIDERRISIGLPPRDLKKKINQLRKVYFGM